MRRLIKPLGIIHNGLPGSCLDLIINLVTTSVMFRFKWLTYGVVALRREATIPNHRAMRERSEHCSNEICFV